MSTIQCTACGGNGYIMRQVQHRDKDGNVTTRTEHQRCSRCGGSGSIQGH